MLAKNIKIGKRHRVDMGDLASLVADIEQNGLLQPIAVTPEGELIAGERRLRAWLMSDFKDEPIPHHVVPIKAIVMGEASENFQRKQFTPSEMVAIWRALEPEYRKLALERQRAGVKAQPHEASRSIEAVAKLFGISRRTLEKACVVVDAAQRDPAKFGRFPERMDRSGKVDGLLRRIRGGARVTARRASRGPYAVEFAIADVELVGQRIGDITIAGAKATLREANLLRVIVEAAERAGVAVDEGQMLCDLLPEDIIRKLLREYS